MSQLRKPYKIQERDMDADFLMALRTGMHSQDLLETLSQYVKRGETIDQDMIPSNYTNYLLQLIPSAISTEIFRTKDDPITEADFDTAFKNSLAEIRAYISSQQAGKRNNFIMQANVNGGIKKVQVRVGGELKTVYFKIKSTEDIVLSRFNYLQENISILTSAISVINDRFNNLKQDTTIVGLVNEIMQNTIIQLRDENSDLNNRVGILESKVNTLERLVVTTGDTGSGEGGA